MDDEPSTPAGRLHEAMRAWHTAFSDLGRQFGAHLGVHSSDAAALLQISAAEDRGAPLTQTHLAQRIGLSAAATSSLLTRLEDAGHIERHRSSADRRVVTLRSSPAMHEELHRFFRGVSDDLDSITDGHSQAILELVTTLVTDMTAVMDHHLDGMADVHASRP